MMVFFRTRLGEILTFNKNFLKHKSPTLNSPSTIEKSAKKETKQCCQGKDSYKARNIS